MKATVILLSCKAYRLTCSALFLATAMAAFARAMAGNHAPLFSAATVRMNSDAALPMKTVQTLLLSMYCFGSGFAICVIWLTGTVCRQGRGAMNG